MRHDHFNFKTVVRCQNPKNEANGRRITDFKQIWQISASRTIALLHTYSPKWLFHCTKHSRGQTSKPGNCTGACVHKATRADTQRRPHRGFGFQLITGMLGCITQPTPVHYWYTHGRMLLKPLLSDSWSTHTPLSPSPPQPASKADQNAAHLKS